MNMTVIEKLMEEGSALKLRAEKAEKNTAHWIEQQGQEAVLRGEAELALQESEAKVKVLLDALISYDGDALAPNSLHWLEVRKNAIEQVKGKA